MLALLLSLVWGSNFLASTVLSMAALSQDQGTTTRRSRQGTYKLLKDSIVA